MLEEKRETTGSNWTLAYDSFEPEEEGLREALTSTGNGYFCTRGALAWGLVEYGPSLYCRLSLSRL